MLFSGENERPEAVASLQGQSLESWRMFGVDYLPNKQAHDRLFETFMQHSDSCDFFLKLDADMVLRGGGALQTIADAFDADPSLSALLYDVHDWYSDYLIPGLTTFRSSVKWGPNPDELMVDHMPQMQGRALRIQGPPAPLAVHCPNPSPLQAFRYGLHRAVKMLQHDRPPASREPKRLGVHLIALNATWEAYRHKGDRRRLLAVAGAEFGLRTPLAQLPGGYSGTAATRAFEARFTDADEKALVEYVERWRDADANRRRIQALFIMSAEGD
jgi:hypothetical protein